MKVTVIGAAGGIGQSLSLLLKLQLPKGSELRLYDISKVTPGVAADISHIPTSVKVSGSSDNLPEMLKGADIVVVASTVGGLTAGVTRSTLFDGNAEIIADLAENVAKYCPQACLGVITNPVNSLLRVAAGVLEKAGVYDKRKLFGVTTLDVIRSEMFIAEKLGRAPEDISVNVVGGHSEETTVPLFSQVEGSSLPDAELQALTDHVKRAYAEVVEAKAGGGSATLSMAQAAARFVLSLSSALGGKKNVKECAYVESDGTRARFFSQPLLLGANGVEEYLPVGDISPREAEDLKIAVKQLGEDITLGDKFLATYGK